MQRSKLESYEEILTILVGRYLSIDSLAFACKMDCVNITDRISYLIKNGLVEEKQCHNKTLYALTKRGTCIQKTLAITKRLDELKLTIKAVDEALISATRVQNRDEHRYQ